MTKKDIKKELGNCVYNLETLKKGKKYKITYNNHNTFNRIRYLKTFYKVTWGLGIQQWAIIEPKN